MSIKKETTGYPDNFASAEVKKTKAWGLPYVKTAYADMQRDEGLNTESKSARYISNIKRAEGMQSIDDVKEIFSQNTDLTYLKLNYDVSTPLAKMVKIASKTIYNQPYKPQAVPINSSAKTKSDKKRAELILNKELARMAAELKAEEGIEGMLPERAGFTAKSDEELTMHLEMNSKSDESIAIEYLIREGFIKNDLAILERDISTSLVVNKIGGTRVHFDNNYNIKVDVVDMVNFVHSYVDSDNYSDARHVGEILEIPFAELRELIGEEYSDKDLKIIQEKHAVQRKGDLAFGEREYYNSSFKGDSRASDSRVRVMYLQVKQFDAVTYVKKKKNNGNGFFFDKRDNSYEIKEEDKGTKSIVNGGAEAIYHGYWIVGSDYLFKWERKESAYRDRLNGKWDTSAEFDYTIYAPGIKEMQNKSLVEQMRYHDDQLILLELKAQQFIVKADPPGYEYDIGRLKGAIAGMGFGKMTPLEMINIKTQTGNLFSSSTDEMGIPFNHANTANKLASGIDQDLIVIGELYNATLQKMKEVIGMNDAVDGSQPDKKALVRVQEQAAAGHKSALEDLSTAFQYIMKETSKKICQALQMRIRSKIRLEDLSDSVGQTTIKAIELSDIENSDFDIEIEMLPTREEIQVLDLNLQRLAELGQISPEDVFKVKRKAKESTLAAEKLLEYLSKKFREEQEAANQKNIQLQGQENAKLEEMKTQAAQAKVQMESQAKAAELQAAADNEIRVIEAQKVADMELEELKGKLKKEIVELAASTDRETTRQKPSLDSGYSLKKDSLPPGIEPKVMPTTKVT